MRCIKRLVSIFLMVCFLCSNGTIIHALEKKETVVRVGFPIQQGISFIDEQGHHSGYLVDYLEQISLYTGWEYEYVQVDGDLNTQISTLLKMLEAGEIDMLGTMTYNENLNEQFLYPSYSYGTAYTTLAVREDSQEWIEEDFENWDGITVAVYPRFVNRLELLEQYAVVNGFTYDVVPYDSYHEMLEAVKSGEVDATLQVDVSMEEGLRGIAHFSPTPYYFALYKGDVHLLQELNVALNHMNRTYPHLQVELYNRYFAFSDNFFVSEENKEYIKNLGTMKVLFFRGNAPFQYVKDGEVKGFAVSYLDKFAELTGLQYEPVVVDTYEEGIALIENGEVDMIACMTTNSEMLSIDGVKLSFPYFSSNSVVACSSYVSEHNHQDIKEFCINTEGALNNLRTAEHDSIRLDSYSLNYYLRKKELYDNINVDWTNVETFSYTVGITERVPDTLLTILNHYSSSLGDATRQNMLYQNSTDDVEYTLSEFLYIYKYTIASVIILILLLVCIYILYYRGKQASKQIKVSENKIKSLSRYDELTGAYHGRYFRKLLNHAYAQKIPLVLIALNIRNFKHINETYGVSRADKFLCQVKSTLDQAVRSGEFFCRQSADVFYMALREGPMEEISARMQEIYTGIQREADKILEGYPISLYCGGVLTDSSPDPHSIANISYMMAALAQARKQNRPDLCIYDEALHQAEQLRHYVESHMQSALEQEEFQLYLQPKFNLCGGHLDGAEALVRWQSKDRGMIFPDQFIPLFEENGFCVQLDLYMVEQTCKQLRTWMDEGHSPIPISVNQTKLLFYSEGYVDKLLEITKKYNVSPKYITLEILEGLALESVEKLNNSIASLNEAGFRISMDDFGSGYSSLNTLGKIKIDELKIDRLFLIDVAKDVEGNQRKVLASIVALAKELNIRTVAEGVETQENEQMMIELACDYGQGYYYSKPIPASKFLDDFLIPFSKILRNSASEAMKT